MEIGRFVIEVEGERPEYSFDNFLMGFESNLEAAQDGDFTDEECLQHQNLVEEIVGENAVANLNVQATFHSFTAPRLNNLD